MKILLALEKLEEVGEVSINQLYFRLKIKDALRVSKISETFS